MPANPANKCQLNQLLCSFSHGHNINMVGRENSLVYRNEAGITLESYIMRFSEKVEAHVLLEKWDRSVLDINTMLSFPCGKGKDPVALVSKCFCGRLLLHKVTYQIRSNSSHRQLWLADCRRLASDEIYFLSLLVSSVLDIVESLRKRVVACSASSTAMCTKVA